jgi:hypothetical protein
MRQFQFAMGEMYMGRRASLGTTRRRSSEYYRHSRWLSIEAGSRCRIETRYRETQAAMEETRSGLAQQLGWSFVIVFLLVAAATRSEPSSPPPARRDGAGTRQARRFSSAS